MPVTRRLLLGATVAVPATVGLPLPAAAVTREYQESLETPLAMWTTKVLGKLHSVNGQPSVDMWNSDTGMPVLRIWHEHGQQHRVGGPSSILYNDDGSGDELTMYNLHGVRQPDRDEATQRVGLAGYGWASPSPV